MATRNGVGGSNEPVKLLDEYQLQVPNHLKTKWEFDTIEELEAFKALPENKRKVFDGHKYKTPVKDEKGNEIEGKFNPVLNSNGKLELVYCPVGEMVVKCVEQAAKMMNSPVFITGEYLVGDSWGACH